MQGPGVEFISAQKSVRETPCRKMCACKCIAVLFLVFFDQIQALAQASFKNCSIRRINIHSTEEAIETVKEMGCGMVAQGPRALF